MKFKFILLSLAISSFAHAQDNITINGYVLEATTQKTPISYAVVGIENTAYGVETDENGYFTLELPNGQHTLTASYYGYQSQHIVYNDTLTNITFLLEPQLDEIDEIVINVDQRKNTETALLNSQRKSLEFKQEIGSQELSRKGVSDAAAAVVKTSGVSKQEGSGGIFVRGLGDRYNSTSLNGLPLVSNDPEKKNINLSLFSTDIVDKIAIDKTYLSRHSGDYGGASIDITSKKLSNDPYFALQIGSNVNTNAISQSDFLLPQNGNTFGFQKNQVPTNAPTEFFFTNPINNKTAFPLGASLQVHGGTSWNIGEESKLSLFGTAGFSNDYGFQEGFDNQVNAQGVRLNSYDTKKYNYNTQSTAMVNVSYEINPKHSIDYNFLAVNTSELSYNTYQGFMRDKAETEKGGLVQRNAYVQNTLLTHQLLGNHELTDKNTFYWGASLNQVKSHMPDRMQTSMKYDERYDGYTFITNSSSDNHRYFHGLEENEIALNLAVDHKFAPNEDDNYRGKLTLGYNGRIKNRDFEATQYNFNIAASERGVARDPYQLDDFFNAKNYDAGLFSISTFRGSGENAGEPQYYKGDLNIHAAFAAVEYQLSDRLFAVAGARFESITQDVEWKTQLDNSGNNDQLKKNAFLPNLNVKYELSSIQNLRFAASKTYTLPQFKERAPFIYEDVTEIKFGNKDLYASDNYNVDFKWEYFPNNDEIISATAFGKYIQNPINETNIASSTNDISYVNTGDYGYAAGVEIELRKNIIHFNNDLDHKLAFGINAAYMHTEQELNAEKIARETNFSGNFTHETSKFTGAPEFLMNADLTYFKKWNDNQNFMATLAYNYGSDRVYAIGIEKKGNLVDKGFGMMDLIVKSQLSKQFSIGLNAKNILNPAIDRVQENLDQDILVRSYKLGTNVSLSLQYQF